MSLHLLYLDGYSSDQCGLLAGIINSHTAALCRSRRASIVASNNPLNVKTLSCHFIFIHVQLSDVLILAEILDCPAFYSVHSTADLVGFRN